MSPSPPPESAAHPWAGKVAQRDLVAAADPDLALDLTVLTAPEQLPGHLAARSGTVVLRPEFSDDLGSAVLCRAGAPLPERETADLWARGTRLVAHDHVAGVPHFAGGRVTGGRLELTDRWQCFCLDEGPFAYLTSVINVPPDAPTVRGLADRLQPVVEAAGLRAGPVTFELVLSERTCKVVKFAPRAGGEPLPTLARELAGYGTGFLADYSFITRRPGRLVRIRHLDTIQALGSYAGVLEAPAPGDEVVQRSIEGGPLTVLLRNRDEAALRADIARCQELNRAGVFDLTT